MTAEYLYRRFQHLRMPAATPVARPDAAFPRAAFPEVTLKIRLMCIVQLSGS